MKFGSLFSGIGGFDLGFERAGMTCEWQCEIDTHAKTILKRRFGKEVYNDVRTIGRETGTVDLICGGFPCQDVSIAGRRKGLAGERSGLWFEFARIVKELKPRWVVIENVPGLLSSNGGRDFAVILQELVKFGYGVCWRILDAQFFGVPQRRRRVFIVASLGSGDAAKVLFESEGLHGNPPTRSEAGKETPALAGTLSANRGGLDRPAGNANELDFCVPVSPALGHGGRQDLDNETYVARSLTASNQRNDFETENFIAFQQNTRDEVRLMGGDGRYAGALAAQAGMKQQNYIAWSDQGGNRIDIGDNNMSPTLRAQSHGHPPMYGVRRLTPTDCERLQGFPDGWTNEQADTQRYKQLGNAVAVPVAEWIGKRIVQNEN